MSWDGLKDVVLRIGRSPLADDLVLRGSFAMRVWFGDAARDPRDVDFVAADPNAALGGPLSAEIVRRVDVVLGDPKFRHPLDNYPYTYGWHFDYPDAGVDIAFGEEMRMPPESIEVDGVRLKVVSREESLAWKIHWLMGDEEEPKDLYDAVLLAEHLRATTGTVDLTLARRLVEEEWGQYELKSSWEDHTPDEDDWEYDRLPGRAEEWVARLNAACGPWSQDEAHALKAAGE